MKDILELDLSDGNIDDAGALVFKEYLKFLTKL